MDKIVIETWLCEGDVSQNIDLPLLIKDVRDVDGKRSIGSIVDLYFNGVHTTATMEITDPEVIAQLKAGQATTIGIVDPDLIEKLKETKRPR